MATYFSTFIPGLGEFIAEQINKDLDSIKISLLLDGLVVYKSKPLTEKIKQLCYLNNSFLLIKQYIDLSEDQPIEVMAKDCLKDHRLILPGVKGKSFRVMFYYANTPVAIDKKLHEKIEEKIAQSCTRGHSGKQSASRIGFLACKDDGFWTSQNDKIKDLFLDRTNPDFEYWFLYRKEGYGFFGLRLTKHPDYKDTLEKGQLRPELANIIVLLSNPQKEDIVLDPFAGSGTILIERTRFPYQKIIAGDINSNATKQLKTYFDTSMYRSRGMQKYNHNVEVIKMNALNINMIMDNSIDKIITDPPWGLFSAIGDLQAFYSKTLKEMVRVLKPGGLIVLLVGRNVDMEKILEQLEGKLKIVKMYHILVSGKKARMLMIDKKLK